MLRAARRIGDTLRTTTEVVALRAEPTPRPGRAPTGLAALRIRTIDQEDRPVLDFSRCAMLPLRDGCEPTGHADDLDAIGAELSRRGADARRRRAGTWPRSAPRSPARTSRRCSAAGRAGRVEGGDVVTCAPELARLSLNVAMAHHDAGATGTGRRLVYGGHTIGSRPRRRPRAARTW